MKSLFLLLPLLTFACSSPAKAPVAYPDSFIAEGNTSKEAIAHAATMCGENYRIINIGSSGHKVSMTVLCGTFDPNESYTASLFDTQK